jgi:hypothetical protein
MIAESLASGSFPYVQTRGARIQSKMSQTLALGVVFAVANIAGTTYSHPVAYSVDEVTGGYKTTGTTWPSGRKESDDHGGFSTQVRALHSRSGLTWEQLSRLFGVSRRAVHQWANGGRMNARHTERLAELSQILSELPAAGPTSMRKLLMTPMRGGRSIFDMLRSNSRFSFDDVAGTMLPPEALLLSGSNE